MKLSLHLFSIALLTCGFQARAHAADLADLAAKPAAITAAGMQAAPLAVVEGKKGWMNVPSKLVDHHATIFTPLNDKAGVADITVIHEGYLLLACNYDNQGGESGNWKKDAWDEKQFKLNGWEEIDAAELGGDLIQNDKRQQVIFFKKVSAGEHFVLRCNKYDPPYPIVLK